LVKDDTGDIYPLNSTSYGNSLAYSTPVFGGRTYRAYATTNYVYPTTATLTFNVLSEVPAVGGTYNFQIEGALSNIVDGDFYIQAYGAMVNLYYGRTTCNLGADVTLTGAVSPDRLISRGYAKYGAQGIYLDTGTTYDGFAGAYDFTGLTLSVIDGGGTPRSLYNGDTFTVGSTTVTVSLPTACRRF
jgi:hypothetical protein